MATILEFKDVRRTDECCEGAGEKSTTSVEGGTAQIIFFPGIRIERYDIDPFVEDDELDALRDKSTSSSTL